MKFTKMQGIGNDYVYVDCFRESVPDPVALSRAVSDRHFGIGSDGLILILPSAVADVRMRMFNADGSESEMCGNGVRCVAKYAYDHGLTRDNPMKVETGAGVLMLSLRIEAGKVTQVTVDMGQPTLELAKIPVDRAQLGRSVGEYEFELYLLQAGLVQVAGFVSMGNPHAVMFVDDLEAIDVPEIGPLVEHHLAFPRRINAHWVQMHSRDELTMRTWERGSGITLACGTGACAVAVAAARTRRANRKVNIHLPGGDLQLEWTDNNHVHMTGPAIEVFSGDWPTTGK